MLSVLYVDDEEALLEIGKLFLEQSGTMHVDTITSAIPALRLIRQKNYDAIVSDYQMPEMDGIAFLECLRAICPALPFILFTGRGREEVVIKAFEKGADLYLQKGGDTPSLFAELSRKIDVLVAKKRAEAHIVALNRLYSMFSATNRAIVYIQDKDQLLAEICRIIIDIGGFSMAWAVVLNPKNRLIELTVSYGPVEGYLDRIAISADAGPRGFGPTSSAFRDKKFNICNDIGTDERMKCVREPALRRGFRSLAAFPFAAGTANAGVITIYSDKTGFFDDPVIALLDEMLQDVTFALGTIEFEVQRKKAEHLLREGEERYRTLFQGAAEGILVIDPSTRKVLLGNTAICTLLGYTGDELTFLILDNLHPPEDRKYVLGEFLALSREQKKCARDIPCLRKDGTVFFADIATSRMSLDGRDAVVGFFTDISDRQRAETALRENLAEYRTILRTAMDGFCIVDMNGAFFDVNDAFCRMLGYTKQEMLKFSLADIEMQESQEETARHIQTITRTGHDRFVSRYRCRDGTVIDVEVSVVYSRFHGGRFFSFHRVLGH